MRNPLSEYHSRQKISFGEMHIYANSLRRIRNGIVVNEQFSVVGATLNFVKAEKFLRYQRYLPMLEL